MLPASVIVPAIPVVKLEHAADGMQIAAVVALPEFVNQHHDRWCDCVGCLNTAPQQSLHAEESVGVFRERESS